MNPFEIPDYAAYILAFLTVAPYVLLLNFKALREHAGWFGRFWDRQVASRLDGISTRFFSPAVWLGFLGGFGAVFLTDLVNDNWLLQDPVGSHVGEPISFTLYISFIRAGLVEEVFKCAIAFGLSFVIGFRRGRGFTGAIPFLCAAVGLGFAFLENALFISALGFTGPAQLVVGRAIASAAHVLMGLSFGLGLLAFRKRGMVLAALLSLLIAILIHGIFDFFAIPQGAFPSFLTFAFLCLVFVLALSVMYGLLPATRYRPLRRAHDLEHELFVHPRSRPTGGGIGDRPPLPAEQWSPAMDALWQERLEAVPPPVSDLAGRLRKDGFAARFPESQEAPFGPGDFVRLPVELGSALAREEYRGPVPETLKQPWSTTEAFYSEHYGSGSQADRVWDSTIFALDPALYDPLLLNHGVRLEELSPLRVLEFHNAVPGQVVYLSLGLEALYGFEFWVSFPHAQPMIRWFFLRMAAVRPEQAPWVRMFSPMPVASSLELGEPRGWLRFYLPLPLLHGPTVKALADRNVPEERWPVEILFGSIPDGTFIIRSGVEAFLQDLRRRGQSWHNNIRRPPAA
ncbi:MAG: PrsW family intramembrane metalloprotease [Spirochaetales bacterium]|nr:PrsW family intramembrane metalloprotease [Leptospiraceae bacterium]MCP5483206.1 PrsW family intramembrane metalloprotease [Spirochaetales bacterium]MCP5486710.1 PrsW family intramembrane metalloprotease [Spirochaetales bacterium]